MITILKRMVGELRDAGATALNVLSEIFDEAPYQRFLAHRRMAPSRHSYARFLEETSDARERRPRCC